MGEKVECTRCNNEFEAGSRQFCPTCGKRLTPVEESAEINALTVPPEQNPDDIDKDIPLGKCPHCDKFYDVSADKCPSCGRRRGITPPEKRSFASMLMIGLLIGLALGVLAGIGYGIYYLVVHPDVLPSVDWANVDWKNVGFIAAGVLAVVAFVCLFFMAKGKRGITVTAIVSTLAIGAMLGYYPDGLWYAGAGALITAGLVALGWLLQLYIPHAASKVSSPSGIKVAFAIFKLLLAGSVGVGAYYALSHFTIPAGYVFGFAVACFFATAVSLLWGPLVKRFGIDRIRIVCGVALGLGLALILVYAGVYYNLFTWTQAGNVAGVVAGAAFVFYLVRRIVKKRKLAGKPMLPKLSKKTRRKVRRYRRKTAVVIRSYWRKQTTRFVWGVCSIAAFAVFLFAGTEMVHVQNIRYLAGDNSAWFLPVQQSIGYFAGPALILTFVFAAKALFVRDKVKDKKKGFRLTIFGALKLATGMVLLLGYIGYVMGDIGR